MRVVVHPETGRIRPDEGANTRVVPGEHFLKVLQVPDMRMVRYTGDPQDPFRAATSDEIAAYDAEAAIAAEAAIDRQWQAQDTAQLDALLDHFAAMVAAVHAGTFNGADWQPRVRATMRDQLVLRRGQRS